ncbi:hypothetical protein PYW08_011059 [Mythimna loreyi]|uniref:Uncharacterized protein n=1 Tax=Mythimna loreyi TaxID=667449 RepID=A0ACC2Q2I7_9NEOP|nr:hypothetical protein PYW08_011059 [Mythimna loreyi]
MTPPHPRRVNQFCRDFAMDNCGRHIYWITDEGIGRTRLGGNKKEILVNSSAYLRISLTIDQQSQRMYWIELTQSGDEKVSIKSAKLNGKDITTVYVIEKVYRAFSLTVSKDYIYWQNYYQDGIWQLPKNQTLQKAKKITSTRLSFCVTCHLIATRYTIKEQIQGIQSCEALQRFIPRDSKNESTASVCQNYCFQGECSFSDEGDPTCSCKPGYSGERCEVNACHQYCLNGGVCSLNEASAPVCKCSAEYEGDRCEVSTFAVKCIQTVSMLKNLLNADVTSFTLSKGVKSTCDSPVV